MSEALLLERSPMREGLVFNSTGTRAAQDSSVRWNCPRWLRRVAGALEMTAAVMIAVQDIRDIGPAFRCGDHRRGSF